MPDWFYRTVSQPVLFRLPAAKARNFALGFMGWLARLPGGRTIIDLMGHMRADERLRCNYGGIEFPSAVGLGPHLDANAIALPALAQFGVGFIEVGPITVADRVKKLVVRLPEHEAILLGDPPGGLSLAEALPRLAEAAKLGLPLVARIGGTAAECVRLARELGPSVAVFALEATSSNSLAAVMAAAERPVLLCVSCEMDVEQIAAPAGLAGFVVDGSVHAEDGRVIGLPLRQQALDSVRRLRERFGAEPIIAASGGVHEPGDALELRRAGANLVEVDSGLVYSGPGLPKRINEALLFEATRGPSLAARNAETRPAAMSWFWCFLMGAGMFTGSLLALAIAATRVVLPYDEQFVGMSREQLHGVNPRLLAFMAHDRVSLAGTMVAIGIMYAGLSLFGIRRGLHWAQMSVFASASVGFASFFLFLGFGYFDIFHAFVTLALLQLLLLGIHCPLGEYVPTTPPPLKGDASWRRSLWGQLLLIGHAFGLIGAGLTICSIGVTHVFVHEDLDFMHTTAADLVAANDRLVPLVAHDRATMGGMLLAGGLVFLLPALWGFQAGSSWLWWTMLLAGLSAYAAAIGVHFAVGYTNAMHLLPAFAGLAAFAAGMALSRAFLCGLTHRRG